MASNSFPWYLVKEGKEEWLSAWQRFRLRIWGYISKKRPESWQDNKEKLAFVICLWSK